jgi:hypothetical protein
LRPHPAPWPRYRGAKLRVPIVAGPEGFEFYLFLFLFVFDRLLGGLPYAGELLPEGPH